MQATAINEVLAATDCDQIADHVCNLLRRLSVWHFHVDMESSMPAIGGNRKKTLDPPAPNPRYVIT
jgi:hypothetical protein